VTNNRHETECTDYTRTRKTQKTKKKGGQKKKYREKGNKKRTRSLVSAENLQCPAGKGELNGDSRGRTAWPPRPEQKGTLNRGEPKRENTRVH